MKQLLRRSNTPRSISKAVETDLMSGLHELQKRLEKRRDPDLHGGPGNLFEAITEDGLWELSVAMRASPANTIDGVMEDAAVRQNLRALYTRRNTRELISRVDKVLSKVSEELGCECNPAGLRRA